MMEAARSSEMLVNFYQITGRYNPEDSHFPIKLQLSKAGLCFRHQVKVEEGQKAYLLGPLVELASDPDSTNIGLPGISSADNTNHLWDITHDCYIGHQNSL
jgi:hypothetical protein